MHPTSVLQLTKNEVGESSILTDVQCTDSVSAFNILYIVFRDPPCSTGSIGHHQPRRRYVGHKDVLPCSYLQLLCSVLRGAFWHPIIYHFRDKVGIFWLPPVDQSSHIYVRDVPWNILFSPFGCA